MQTLIEGKYEVLAKLREGGMGALYKVRHTLLDEIRVIKFMRASLEEDEEARRRFHQEAKLAISLKHPNIVQTFDFSEDSSGNFYMVMEFVEGVNLAEFVAKNGPPHPVLALDIAIQSLMALGYLHECGIVHRDISPENVMLTQEGDDRIHAKLIDLGVAKQTRGQGMTRTGMFLGKLKYASPEQLGALPRGEKIDGRSDLYSMGCVLYQGLTGMSPFEADSPTEYLTAHISRPPRPFEETDPERKIPSDLRIAILRSLEKGRADRYSNAGEFADALRECRDRLLDSMSSREALGAAARDVERMSATRSHERESGVSDAQELVAKAFRTTPTPSRSPSSSGSLGSARLTPRPGPVPGDTTDRTMVTPREPTAPPAPLPAAPSVPVPLLSPRKTPFALFAGGVLILVATAIGIALLRRQPPPPPAGNGTVLLTASPWGRIVRVRDETVGRDLPLTASSTPARFDLPAGRYVITVRWEGTRVSGEAAVPVEVAPGGTAPAHARISSFDVDKAVAFYAP